MKLIQRAAILGATTLAATAIATVPANAVSATLKYDCAVPYLGTKVFTLSADTDAPATLATGTAAPLKTSADVTVPADLVDQMRTLLQAKSIGGTGDMSQSIDGVSTSHTLTIAETPVPPSGPMVVKATGATGSLTAGAVGTAHKIAAGAFTAKMVITKADNTKQNFDIPCTPQPSQDLTVDTVTSAAATTPTDPPATQVETKTTLKGKYVKAKKSIMVTAKVAGATDGKLKLTLKKGKKSVKTVTVNVSTSGAAKATFKKIKAAGKYVVEGNYLGSTTAKPSVGKVKVVVKK